ncbi:arsenate reductase (glutaredoxin) [Parvibaculum sedimenti]|uniref:Arsenate reductase n=1 Tax=Parvibaculum sedimenti TaxID=2608632 RepID=A0A6N6VQ96_9HYPH|nr:arsenate reductase (glutaredoxin) [Parvibaculum sedimenti]KAB7741254.1 arsenate reductase (glutaredoxin) [Parvibaculum sedimenti]
MSKVIIWHNPRCSKSRATLSLIEQHGLDPEIVDYLKTPPSADEIKSVLKKLRMKPRDLMRKGEQVYTDLGLDNEKLSDDQLVAAMAENPILIERPVVIFGARAKLGRPPEDVLDLFTGL